MLVTCKATIRSCDEISPITAIVSLSSGVGGGTCDVDDNTLRAAASDSGDTLKFWSAEGVL